MPGRLTVVDTVYHQLDNEQAEVVEVSFTRAVLSDEQVYLRKNYSVDSSWKEIDTGWVGTSVGMLIVKNLRERRDVNPTQEQTIEEEKRFVEIGIQVSGSGLVDPYAISMLKIPCGESARFVPVNPSLLRICCPNGKAKVTIAAIKT